MNICVIGNSHTGALKNAWDKIQADHPGEKITFFAQRGGGISDLVVQEGKLIPNNESLEKALEFTSEGKKEIDPNEYNVFLIYGAGLAYFPNKQQFYSTAVIKTAVIDHLTEVKFSISLTLLKKLRSITDKPIFIGHCPLGAAKEIFSDFAPNDYLAGIKLVNEIIYNPLDAELVKQPVSTIINERYTHPDFAKGSKRLSTGDTLDDELHSENDMGHMNEKFGEIWLREFFENYIRKIMY